MSINANSMNSINAHHFSQHFLYSNIHRERVLDFVCLAEYESPEVAARVKICANCGVVRLAALVSRGITMALIRHPTADAPPSCFYQ